MQPQVNATDKVNEVLAVVMRNWWCKWIRWGIMWTYVRAVFWDRDLSTRGAVAPGPATHSP